MIGQTNLLKKLNSYNVDNFPRSLLLVGEEGSGKHIVINYIRDNIIHFPVAEITSNLSEQYINQIYLNPNPHIYLIDLNQLMEREQNILLKLLEEPLNGAFIALITDSKASVLHTIINRCSVFEMDNYTRDELIQFIPEGYDQELILDIFRTPGQILNNNISIIDNMCELCDNIINKIHLANYSKVLSIGDKINYKDDYDKFSVNLFLDTLISKLYKMYISSKDIKYFNSYMLTITERKKLLDKRINKEIFVQNYLTQLWKVSRGG